MEILIKRLRLVLFFSWYVSLHSVSQVFFAPRDNLTSLFIKMIEAEQKSIYGAIYMFTDKKIAQAFINAYERGVDVQLIIDQISMTTCGKGKFLQQFKVPVLVHTTKEFNSYTTALMHNKYFIFGCNVDNKSLVWTGSWNCTLRATKHNDENVLILDDISIINEYQKAFAQLQKRLLAATVEN